MDKEPENAVLMLLKPYVDNLVENAINCYLETHRIQDTQLRESVREQLRHTLPETLNSMKIDLKYKMQKPVPSVRC